MSFSAQKATPFEVSNEALNKIVNLKTNLNLELIVCDL